MLWWHEEYANKTEKHKATDLKMSLVVIIMLIFTVKLLQKLSKFVDSSLKDNNG